MEIRLVECKMCGKVKQKTSDRLTDHPFDIKRFASLVRGQCQIMTSKDGSEETGLDWSIIKIPDKP